MSVLSTKVCICVLLSLRAAVRDICSTFARSGVPLDLIAHITKHLKRQMILLGNQLESVPLCNIIDVSCYTQGKHKSYTFTYKYNPNSDKGC